MMCTHCDDGKKVPADFVNSGGRLPIFSCPECTACIQHEVIVAALRGLAATPTSPDALAIAVKGLEEISEAHGKHYSGKFPRDVAWTALDHIEKALAAATTPPSGSAVAMREALEPFAEAAKTFDSWSNDMRHADSQNICTFIPEGGTIADGKTINYGHCRKARAALAAAPQPQEGEPVAWVATHPGRGVHFGTMAETQQGATSCLMMMGIAGNHGWSIIPLFAISHSRPERS